MEQTIRECLAEQNRDKINEIIDQLCRDFAYAVHHPNARNGGLIGLAAAAIALGPNEVPSYLEDIIHPVLACFGDQDARVRYYACESLYNIAKVAKGEILLYFNEIFDVLCKLSTDSETSVKNGADLLDRLVKDIVAEKAATYVSIIHRTEPQVLPSTAPETDPSKPTLLQEPQQNNHLFQLSRFIPLLKERIYVINPFARMFLVSWIALLDSIPDLELISYLPSFLGGLISFLSDPSKDVRVATQSVLDGFLQEINRIAHIKARVASMKHKSPIRKSSANTVLHQPTEEKTEEKKNSDESPSNDDSATESSGENSIVKSVNQLSIAKANETENTSNDASPDADDEDDSYYIPGQDVFINYDKVIEILISHLDSSAEEIQLMVLSWIEAVLTVSPRSLLPYAPRFLSVLLPAMAYDGAELRNAAERVNNRMLDLILEISETDDNKNDNKDDSNDEIFARLDYSAVVNSLTLHFLNEKQETRTAALDWLIMLHRKVPRKILAINDGTFPALLKTLSDPSEEVVKKDLQLLAQISYNSNDEYFTVFMVNLLKLFSTDRRLLDTRGNLIIRQLCVSLNPERIYRTLAEILENDDDVEFASIMVQNLNNNLISAPELSELRERLGRLEKKDGSGLFVALFKSWCHNSVAALSLCLLAHAYEHAYVVLQIMVEFEITVTVLVQIDKLVQLLESPVFTRLRLQLLEPDKSQYLYKCLYGILMLLPQSNAFKTLRNRLNSVSAIGYLHLPKRSMAGSTTTNTTTPKDGRSDVKWTELLDKFRQVQSKLQATRQVTAGSNIGLQPLRTNLITSPTEGTSESRTRAAGSAVQKIIKNGGSDNDKSLLAPPVPKKADAVKRFGRGSFGLGRDKT